MSIVDRSTNKINYTFLAYLPAAAVAATASVTLAALDLGS